MKRVRLSSRTVLLKWLEPGANYSVSKPVVGLAYFALQRGIRQYFVKTLMKTYAVHSTDPTAPRTPKERSKLTLIARVTSHCGPDSNFEDVVQKAKIPKTRPPAL